MSLPRDLLPPDGMDRVAKDEKSARASALTLKCPIQIGRDLIPLLPRYRWSLIIP